MTEQPEQRLPEEQDAENASNASSVPENNPDPTPETPSEAKQSWHVPEGEASPKHDEWYVPENAATLEQLEAMQTSFKLDASVDLSDVPSRPEKTGAWYSPKDDAVAAEVPEEPKLPDASEELPLAGTQLIRQASSIGDILDQDAFRTTMEDADTGFRKAPAIEGDVPTDFADAPEVPLSSSLQSGLGGLRDEPAPTVEGTGEVNSLSPEDVALSRESESQPIEVPAKGFGGVQDQFASTGQKPSIDTGPMVPADHSQPQLVEPTPTFQEVPQIPQQSTPQPSISQSSQPMSPQSPQESAGQRFREVENAVQSLRQQFAQGRITRGQLEAELRRLMVLDDQGRWWTLGVDSSRWYRYDGREWIPDTPPQTGAQVSVGSQRNYVPTETNVQPSVSPSGDPSIPSGGDISMQPGGVPKIALDEYGMPLPQRVPQEDHGATLVNLSAQDLVASGGEPTLAKIDTGGRAPASMEADTMIPLASPSDSKPLTPSEAAQTVVDMARDADAGAYNYGADGEIAEGSRKKREEDSLQPDYSEAFGKPLNRSGVVKFGIWASVLGIVAVLGMTLCVLLSMVGYYFYTVRDFSDEISALPDRASTFQTTTIYANDGTTVLAEYDDPNRGIRQKVTLEEVSPWMIHAIISTEDETFYENPGFSLFAIGRAMYTNVLGSGPRSGASTITQQLARRLLLNEEFAADVSAERKVTEIVLAAEISRQYTKTEILELYLNEMSFGNRAIGIEAAAQIYFQKSAWELNVYESAYLAGLLQAPGYYTPSNRDEFGEPLGLGRMDTVLRLMMEANSDGCIDMQHQFTANANFGVNNEGPEFDPIYNDVYGQWATNSNLCLTQAYLTDTFEIINRGRLEQRIRSFEPPVRDVLYAHFVNWVWDDLVATYGEEYIYNTGLQVVTTLDPTIQGEAQTAVRDQIASWGVVNNGSVVAIDPRTGAVLALVGSADFNSEAIDGQVNVAFSPQQPGSSIKPLVYLSSFIGRQENGEFVDYLTPSSVMWDTRTTWGEGFGAYTPVNYDREYRGPVSIRNALANSLNVPAVKALEFVGTDRFTEVALQMGVGFPLETPIEAGLPSALGGVDVELFDMVAAYAAFANNGMRSEPFGILRISTIEGEGIYDFSVSGIPEGDQKQVIDPGLAFLISDITSDSNARAAEFGGPPTNLDVRISGVDYDAAAKTGSTNDNRDAWTIGWTPQIVVGVWMGNTDNTSMGNSATGFALASPVWNRVMVSALQGTDPQFFQQPSNVSQATVCRDTGALPPNNDSSQCGVGDSYSEYFIEARPPKAATEGTVQTIRVDPFTNRIANEFCNYGEDLLERNFLSVDDPTVGAWLQTGLGQNWAAQRNIDVNTISGSLPTEECQPGQSAPVAQVSSPPNGSVVQAQVEFTGQATVPNFSHYELQVANLNDPNAFSTIQGQRFEFPAENLGSTLAFWASNGLPDGQYYFRVRVFSQTGAWKDSNQVLVTISNNVAPSQPTEPLVDDGTGTDGTGTDIDSGDTTDTNTPG